MRPPSARCQLEVLAQSDWPDPRDSPFAMSALHAAIADVITHKKRKRDKTANGPKTIESSFSGQVLLSLLDGGITTSVVVQKFAAAIAKEFDVVGAKPPPSLQKLASLRGE